jgi:hypothetical protein
MSGGAPSLLLGDRELSGLVSAQVSGDLGRLACSLTH